jgi:hypothetical protein
MQDTQDSDDMGTGDEEHGRLADTSQCSELDPPSSGDRKKGTIPTISNLPQHIE